MVCEIKLAEGARNLLLKCAELGGDETLLIVQEDPKLGWYDPQIANVIEREARKLGVSPTRLHVGGPRNDPDPRAVRAIGAHDVTIFLARLGDQGRFADPVPGRRSVMCYARDADMLASSYGRADHHAFMELKVAIDAILLGADEVRITCPLGTDISGRVSPNDKQNPVDVSVRRFPLGVPLPLGASDLSGCVALARYLSSTGSRSYSPAAIIIGGTVMAHISQGRIAGFSGDAIPVQSVRDHHRMVADTFGIDGDVVHSFHAGIHPGCAYDKSADLDPDLWSNTIFTNPRVLHFHVCGNYAPGEISWVVIDPTLSVDGKALWLDGRLCLEDFDGTQKCLDRWADLAPLFASPARAIGL